MRILIIEDEPASAGRLRRMVEEIEPGTEVLDVLDSIRSAVDWFKTHTEPDLAFFDIHLADGLSLDIFREIHVSCPVIFTTAFDQYAIQAFKVNSIDYLLKPIKKEELASALNKFNSLKRSTSVPDLNKLSELLGKPKNDHLKRIVVRLGQQLKVLDIDEAAYFYIDQKIVYGVSFNGDRLPLDMSLDELENKLDPQRFFRINRAFIISLGSIDSLITYSKARIKVKLHPPCDLESISSTERSPLFREWLRGSSQ
jgi:DNA-binding LytR/AlgR family response regulator